MAQPSASLLLLMQNKINLPVHLPPVFLLKETIGLRYVHTTSKKQASLCLGATPSLSFPPTHATTPTPTLPAGRASGERTETETSSSSSATWRPEGRVGGGRRSARKVAAIAASYFLRFMRIMYLFNNISLFVFWEGGTAGGETLCCSHPGLSPPVRGNEEHVLPRRKGGERTEIPVPLYHATP